MDLLYLLEHARCELHSLMVLLLQHIHVKVIQVVISVIIHPTLIQLVQQGQDKSYQLPFRVGKEHVWCVSGMAISPVSLAEPIASTHLGVLHWLKELLLPHGFGSRCHWSELWRRDLFIQSAWIFWIITNDLTDIKQTWIIRSPSRILPSFAAMLFGSICAMRNNGDPKYKLEESGLRGFKEFARHYTHKISYFQENSPHWHRSPSHPHHRSCSIQ